MCVNVYRSIFLSIQVLSADGMALFDVAAE